MRRRPVLVLAIAAAASLVLAACTQTAPPPAPTQAPAVPTKAAEPTKPAAQPTSAPTAAPAAQPTALPAPPKTTFPEKGKTITIIVPYDPGGPNDTLARLSSPFVEKVLGVPVQVVNKPGASSQLGVTEVAKSKPDGYTIGMWNLPTIMTVYLDPERKSAFTRKDLQPLTIAAQEPAVFAVHTDSPFKTLKDLVDTAKANPGKVTYGTAGYAAINHQTAMTFEEMAGVKMAAVHFNGSAPEITALLGRNVDFASTGILPPVVAGLKSGQLRVLAIADKQESPKLPGVKTFTSLGYPLNVYNSYTYGLPAGVPKDVLDTLANAYKTVAGDPDYKAKLEEAGMTATFIGPADYAAFWEKSEPEVAKLMDRAKAEQK